MIRNGVNFPEPLKKEEWGRMAKIADPGGNILWLPEASTVMVRATLNSRAPVRRWLPRNRERSAERLENVISFRYTVTESKH